jgi:hypothetical protein
MCLSFSFDTFQRLIIVKYMALRIFLVSFIGNLMYFFLLLTDLPTELLHESLLRRLKGQSGRHSLPAKRYVIDV